MQKKIDLLACEAGERLKQIRGSKTQAEFAKFLGIGRTTLIRYEAGERRPDVELLVKLNMLYGIQPLWLLTGKFEATSGVQLSARERALLDVFRHATEAGKAALEATAAALAEGK